LDLDGATDFIVGDLEGIFVGAGIGNFVGTLVTALLNVYKHSIIIAIM
jgi:hypothetical protein